jgi:hypothetical protein
MQIDGSIGSQGRGFAGIVSGVLYGGCTHIYVANSRSICLFFTNDTPSSNVIVNHLKVEEHFDSDVPKVLGIYVGRLNIEYNTVFLQTVSEETILF